MDIFSPEAPIADPLPDDAPRLLVVDESRTALQVMGKRLTRMGYRVSLSDNGFEALDLLAARRFDLVLVEMAMTGLSGLAVLREVRANPASAATPVLMLTGRADNGAAIEALDAGADDWMVKPFSFEVLGARIARLLDRARAFDALRRSNEALDARIAHRAIELGELRQELAAVRAELLRLSAASASA
jgi:DNA-binding response OmpR family regulator